MFKKRSKIKVTLGLLLCAISISVAPAATMVTYAATETDVEVCSDIKQWRYKIEDGKMYKRLYNTTTGKWEGDWIYVCDYPEGI